MEESSTIKKRKTEMDNLKTVSIKNLIIEPFYGGSHKQARIDPFMQLTS
jgi:hypothetical protein